MLPFGRGAEWFWALRGPLCYRLAGDGVVLGFETASLLPFGRGRGGFGL